MIPGCRSSVQNNEWKSTGITVYQLPSKDPLRKEWLKVIGKFRRKGGPDSFDPKKQKVNVCEFHFKPDELYRTLGCGRKKYTKGSVPSVFEMRPQVKKPKRKSPRKRPPPIEYSSESIIESDSTSNEDEPMIDGDNEPHETVSEIELL